MKHLFWIVTLIALLVSCHRDELPVEDITGAISFDIAYQTRAVTEYTDDAGANPLTSMSVFAYLTDGDWSASATPNFMYNKQVARTGVGAPWIYTPLLYWVPNKQHSFFAYVPHVESNTRFDLSLPTQTGAPQFTYKPEMDVAKHIDLLYADPVYNKSNPSTSGANNPIQFNFHHALTKITFSAGLESGYAITSQQTGTTVTVEAITLSNLWGIGLFTFGNPVSWIPDTQADDKDNPDYYVNTFDITDPGLAEIKLDATKQNITTNKGAMMVIPQNITGRAGTDKPLLSIIVRIDKLPLTNSEHRLISYDLDNVIDQFETGQAINFEFEYDGSGIIPCSIRATVTPWDDEEVDGNTDRTYLNVSGLTATIQADSSYTIYYWTNAAGGASASVSGIAGGAVSGGRSSTSNGSFTYTPANTGIGTVVITAGQISRTVTINVN